MGADAARGSGEHALWARGVTPTNGMPHQHISRSSPSGAGRRPSTGRPAHPTLRWGERHADRVRLLVLVSLNRVSLGLASLGLASLGLGPAASSEPPWTWPVDPVRVVVPYVAPAHAYGAGHRGIDVAADGDVRAPADGVVAFSGRVVDRDVLTIDVGDGVVVTFEPVTSALPAGMPVRAGDVVAGVGSGGHSAPGTLHIGVRESGAYVNPLRYLGGVPRAILLPCC